jgi:hypothetical protein
LAAARTNLQSITAPEALAALGDQASMVRAEAEAALGQIEDDARTRLSVGGAAALVRVRMQRLEAAMNALEDAIPSGSALERTWVDVTKPAILRRLGLEPDAPFAHPTLASLDAALAYDAAVADAEDLLSALQRDGGR